MTTGLTIVILAIAIELVANSESKTCVKINNCMCRFDDGSGIVSLYDVGSTDPTSPLVNGWTILHDEGNYYYYNPCYPFNEGPIWDTSACIYNSTYGGYCEIGSWDSVVFSYNGGHVFAEYNGNNCGLQRTTTVVNLMCEPTNVFPAVALGRLSHDIVWISIGSKYLCPKEELTTEMPTTEQETTEVPLSTPKETTEMPLSTHQQTSPLPFTTMPETTEMTPTTASEAPGTTSKPAILCDYKTLVNTTLKRCVSSGSDSSITPFAPPYLSTDEQIKQFCTNINLINKCVQDAIVSCAFDGRVTALFGTSGLGLQAAYESLCAHKFTSITLPAMSCLSELSLDEFLEQLNSFIVQVDESSNPEDACKFASNMITPMMNPISEYCFEWFDVWGRFWDNFMLGCN